MPVQTPITMDNVVGNRVLVILHRAAYDSLKVPGIEGEKFVAHIAGIDSFGLWVENPNHTTIPVYDDNGNYIPPENRKEVTHRAIFLLQWQYIQSILQFPEREAYVGGEEEQHIGFSAMVNKPGAKHE